MELAHIPLNKLSISTQNMRHSARAPDVSDIMPSIKKLGIQQPLLVRKNGEGFEIVAGRRCYFSLMEIAKNDKSDKKVEDVPCTIMAAGDDAAALEASLIENVARLNPDLMSRFETFTKLVEQGKTVTDVAETFGVTEIMVKRSLALGNLIPAIRKLFQAEEIDMETIRLLTLASVKQQKKWLKLQKKNDEPRTWQLKQWLFDGELKLSAALFPLEDYKGQIVTDLFGEEGYFTNSKKFWSLQNRYIVEMREKYIKEGWDDVIIMETGDQFCEWEHTKTLKTSGGRVYIEVRKSGEVGEYKGYITTEEFNRKEKRLLNKDKNIEPVNKPELTKAAQNYVALHRHNAVRVSMFSRPNVALRLMVAHAICGAFHWKVNPNPQRADKIETSQSIYESIAQKAFFKERDEVFKLLNWPTDGDLETCTNNYSFEAINVFLTLKTLSDEDVLRILTFVMAETMESNTSMTEILGNEFKVNMWDFWQPEGHFFDLIRDRNAINAMVADIG
ncbi:MAG: ParB/RepB/Spo0J family partition protein, partial [Rhizobiales bacterium]|nr:ParB/RepB/Spo0J family partition protein [Hyphomicrobiales bacterium]